MGSFLGIGAAASAAVMVCVAGAGAGCGGSTFTAGSDAGSDGRGGSSGSGSGGASSSGSSGGSSSGSGGGSNSGSGGGSGSGSGGGSGSSSGGGMSPCPANPPGDGAACMPNGVQCEYGTNPNPSCDEIDECLNGTWSISHPASCPTGTCPNHFADVPQGQTCTPDGLDCAYLEGQCNCSFSAPAGVGPNPSWHCFQPAGCPEPRPRVGAACAREGLSCDYGACTGGLAETCTGGYWHWTMTPCPG